MSLKSLYRKLILHRWDIAFVENELEEILAGRKLRYNYIKHNYSDRWFADPFILDVTPDRIILLVEEYRDVDKIGMITKLVIDRKSNKLLEDKIILKLDSHLSFPAILRKDDKVYLYPENNLGGGLFLYEYDITTDKLVRKNTLSIERLVDAYYSEEFGRCLLFATKEPLANKNILEVYESNSFMENFIFCESIFFPENIARNAGSWFSYKGMVYRPAQESNKTYGHAISFQRVKPNNDTFIFDEVSRLHAPKGAFGIHTFNMYGDIKVVDVKKFRHPLIATPLFGLRNVAGSVMNCIRTVLR